MAKGLTGCSPMSKNTIPPFAEVPGISAMDGEWHGEWQELDIVNNYMTINLGMYRHVVWRTRSDDWVLGPEKNHYGTK